ncbi:hypothetical protein RHSIM_Rhsim07G0216800 [Rhododendron simsii]|uniref:J domain-containing protein n=1 Tax=Rhododendron simsii TaxID=118357 RepID=A0A834LGH1_RHOSS|nr:hypothetical protein RHSIM_Rhsim07G0216800 [Rhododendron simsii]
MNNSSSERNAKMRNNDHDDDKPLPNRPRQEKAEDMKLWGILIFGLIGATATTFALKISIAVGGMIFQVPLRLWDPISKVGQLRRSVDWFYYQLTRSQSSWKSGTGGSFRSSFQEEAWKRYNRRMQEEYEEEMERVERIRRMQSVFNRERSKYKRSYESWRESGPGAYHQHFQREDWYWKTNTSNKDQRSNFRETPQGSATYALSHHYSVLGLNSESTYLGKMLKGKFRKKVRLKYIESLVPLMSSAKLSVDGKSELIPYDMILVLPYRENENVLDKSADFVRARLVSDLDFVILCHFNRLRTQPYTDNEIKTAFRAKAMQYHPDQNQDNKELAEAKFKEVMTSYEAIKTERKNNKA